MRTRHATGRYTPHNTPGDGTGFSRVPESDAQAFMGKLSPERGATDAGPQGAERHAPVDSGRGRSPVRKR